MSRRPFNLWAWSLDNGEWSGRKLPAELLGGQVLLVVVEGQHRRTLALPPEQLEHLRHGGAWSKIDGRLVWLGLSAAEPSHLRCPRGEPLRPHKRPLPHRQPGLFDRGAK